VVKAGPKYECCATNTVGEPVYASPAIADGRIFIRGEKNLFLRSGVSALKQASSAGKTDAGIRCQNKTDTRQLFFFNGPGRRRCEELCVLSGFA